MIIRVCLRGLDHGQIYRQTESIKTFQVCWKVLKSVFVPSLFYILSYECVKTNTKKY